MTIKLINENLSDSSFKEKQIFLIEKFGRQVEFTISDMSSGTESLANEDETIVFESPDSVKIYSRVDGYRRMSLQSFISQKEASLGISIH